MDPNGSGPHRAATRQGANGSRTAYETVEGVPRPTIRSLPQGVGEALYDVPARVAAASGRCTKNKPLLSARTVELLVRPASSSKVCNENGDRNRMPSAEEYRDESFAVSHCRRHYECGCGCANT